MNARKYVHVKMLIKYHVLPIVIVIQVVVVMLLVHAIREIVIVIQGIVLV